MNLEIYSVYDSKAEAYLPPFFMTNEQTAKRVFFNASNDKLHQFGANPADYGLFHIGQFNDESAIITPLKIPKSLGLAQEYVQFQNATITEIGDAPTVANYKQAKGE